MDISNCLLVGNVGGVSEADSPETLAAGRRLAETASPKDSVTASASQLTLVKHYIVK